MLVSLLRRSIKYCAAARRLPTLLWRENTRKASRPGPQAAMAVEVAVRHGGGIAQPVRMPPSDTVRAVTKCTDIRTRQGRFDLSETTVPAQVGRHFAVEIHSMSLCCSRIYVRRCCGTASYGLAPSPEDVPPLSSLLGEVAPPPPVTPPASEGCSPPVAGMDGSAVCVAGELVVGELPALP